MNKRILVLCTGNSCRSQMAEGFLKSFDNKLEIFSAGTKPAKEVSPIAIIVMKELNIDISSQYPKDVVEFINTPFDYVITVCDNAKTTCPIFMGDVKNKIHIGFEDPYEAKGSNDEKLEVYRKVRNQIKNELHKFYLENLRS